MSRKRRDPRAAKLRRDRIRLQKQREPEAPQSPPLDYRFGMERVLRRFEALQKRNPAGKTTVGAEELAAVDAAKRDDTKWQAQELAYDAMEADDPAEALKLIDAALQLDPDCTDASTTMVCRLPMTIENRIKLMREVVEKAERQLGGLFEEAKGEFWHDLSTRPYMRALQTLGDLLQEAGRHEEAAAVFERMLDLNPDDNQGVRSQLLTLYLAASRLDCARSVLARYPEEDSWLSTFKWGRVMERWLSGELSEAEAALARARENNQFVEDYILGRKPLPSDEPAYFAPGQDSEAQISAREIAPALAAHPGFSEWVRGVKQ